MIAMRRRAITCLKKKTSWFQSSRLAPHADLSPDCFGRLQAGILCSSRHYFHHCGDRAGRHCLVGLTEHRHFDLKVQRALPYENIALWSCMQASSGSLHRSSVTVSHTVPQRSSNALAAYATYKAASLLTRQSCWLPAQGQATSHSRNVVAQVTHTVEAIAGPVDTFCRGKPW